MTWSSAVAARSTGRSSSGRRRPGALSEPAAPPVGLSRRWENCRGSGLTFGAGLDVPLHRWFSVTANFGVYHPAIGDVPLTGTIVDDVITTVYQANFAITLR